MNKYSLLSEVDFQGVKFHESHVARSPFDMRHAYIWSFVFQAHIGPLKLTLLNTHLESTKQHADTRQEQLKDCFSRLRAASPDRVAIFAGDLNLRDHEVG